MILNPVLCLPGDNRKYDIVSLGILVLDIFGKEIDTFPEPGTSVLFNTMEVHPGGCAYNTGVDMSRLGSRVALMGMIGRDVFGDLLIEHMQRERINITGVSRTEKAPTSFSFVMVSPDGERRIYTSFGANGVVSKDDVNLDMIRNARIFHIGGSSMLTELDGEPSRDLLLFARENQVVTCMDPVYRTNTKETLLSCFPYLDVFLPNAEESIHITGYSDPIDQLRYYIGAGVRVAGIKRGAKGCLISDGESIWQIGVYDVQVKDTCGAGDAFIAGFLYGLSMQWDIPCCASFASAVSAFCISAIGTTAVVPNAEQVLRFMNTHNLEIAQSLFK